MAHHMQSNASDLCLTETLNSFDMFWCWILLHIFERSSQMSSDVVRCPSSGAPDLAPGIIGTMGGVSLQRRTCDTCDLRLTWSLPSPNSLNLQRKIRNYFPLLHVFTCLYHVFTMSLCDNYVGSFSESDVAWKSNCTKTSSRSNDLMIVRIRCTFPNSDIMNIMWHRDCMWSSPLFFGLTVSPCFQVKSCPISVHWLFMFRMLRARDAPKGGRTPADGVLIKLAGVSTVGGIHFRKGLAHSENYAATEQPSRQCRAMKRCHSQKNTWWTKCHTWCLWKCPHMTATTRSMNCSDNLFGWTVGIPRFADLAAKTNQRKRQVRLARSKKECLNNKNIWKHVVIWCNM